MKIYYTRYVYGLFIIALVLISTNVFTLSTGPIPGVTNAPGETPCDGCHGPYYTNGIPWNNMSLTTTVPLAAIQAGQTYNMSLTFSNPASSRYGFQVCVLPNNATSTTGSVGTLTVNNSNQTQLVTSGNRNYIEHTFAGNSVTNHTKTWTFNWNVPSTYNGGAVFYVVVNSTNFDNTNSGDTPFAKTFSASVLPVKLLDFSASDENGTVNIYWSTATEINSSRFDIERSEDKQNWETISTVKASGKSAKINRYTYTDYNISESTKYYRLAQVDIDGHTEYSKIVTLNPIVNYKQQTFWFDITSKTINFNSNQTKTVSIYNMSGATLQTIKTEKSQIDLSFLPNAIYILSITENGINKIQKIILN